MPDHALIDKFRQARRDQTLVVLDGLHAVKHALRFGAEIGESVTYDTEAVRQLAAEVAPDVCAELTDGLTCVSREDFRQLSPVPPETGVIAIARRPVIRPDDILRGPLDSPVVLLENPRNPFNIGATVRVAAAAGAAGVLVTGQQDPWHPASVVSAAGLQFALPIARLDSLSPSHRQVVAIDPQGEPMPWGKVPPGPILVFGTERHGISRALLARSARRLAIPMTAGVSSLNLATSAAIALYALKFPTLGAS